LTPAQTRPILFFASFLRIILKLYRLGKFNVAHEYSVQIHDWISQKVSDINVKIKAAKVSDDAVNQAYFTGQLEELRSIRKHLTDKIDLNTQNYFD